MKYKITLGEKLGAITFFGDTYEELFFDLGQFFKYGNGGSVEDGPFVYFNHPDNLLQMQEIKFKIERINE